MLFLHPPSPLLPQCLPCILRIHRGMWTRPRSRDVLKEKLGKKTKKSGHYPAISRAVILLMSLPSTCPRSQPRGGHRVPKVGDLRQPCRSTKGRKGSSPLRENQLEGQSGDAHQTMDAKPVPPRDQGMQRQVVGQKTRPTTLDQAWQTGELSHCTARL